MSETRTAAVFAGVAALLAAVVIFSLAHDRPHRDSAAAPRDAGLITRVPAPPTMPSDVHDGVRLTGFVVDGAGLPVVGAEVSAELEKGGTERALAIGSGSSTGSGSGTRSGGGTGSRSAPAVAVAAPTAADGRFALDGLAPGRYRLRVSGAGLLAAEVRFVPVPSDEARIVVARQVAIEGTVTDGGKPVTTANVGIRGDAIGGTLELKTDATGAFKVPNLPEGRYQVYAWQGALAARAMRVARLGAGPFTPVELRLEAAAIVVGKVTGDGAGLLAAVELRPAGEDQAPRYARTGDDGVFRIEGVPTGRWIADAFAPGFTSPGGVELEAGHGVVELQLQRGGMVEGRVLDGEGRPVAGAAVRALVGTPPSATEVSSDVDRDMLRRFSGRTAAPPPDAGLGGDPTLIARGELGVMVGPIPPLPPPGGEPSRPASVVDPNATSASLAVEPPALPDASIWTTDADGRYRIRGLPKGKVTVLASAAGYAEARSRQVALGAGEALSNVDVVLTQGTYVLGKITDQHGVPVIGAEVTAQPDVGAPMQGYSDGDGMYKLGPLVGTIELRASAFGHASAREKLELAAPRGAAAGEHRKDLVLEIADAILAGTLEDETGAPVGGAHLEVVDAGGESRRAVVAADGTFSIDLLPRGHVRVRVDDPRYPPDELDAVASERGEHVHLRVALGGAVEGVLLDAHSGEPLGGMTVSASAGGGRTAEAVADTKGQWKLGPLKPGHWKLEVTAPGYRAQTRELDVPKSHDPGVASVRDVRIDLSRGALLGGTVRDARGQRLTGAHVTVKLADGTGAAVEGDTDAQGEFRLRDCPTGEVVVSATRGDASGSVRITARGGDEVLGLALEVR